MEFAALLLVLAPLFEAKGLVEVDVVLILPAAAADVLRLSPSGWEIPPYPFSGAGFHLALALVGVAYKAQGASNVKSGEAVGIKA